LKMGSFFPAFSGQRAESRTQECWKSCRLSVGSGQDELSKSPPTAGKPCPNTDGQAHPNTGG